MGVELLRKYVSSSVRICYRSVVKHPFLVGMILFLISMYRLFPSLFSLLLSASPVLVSTAVLLGTLLSLGQPNIPEIEKEEKSDLDEVQNSETHSEIVGRDGSFASEETNGSKIEVEDRSIGGKTSVHDDNGYVEVSRPLDLVDDSVFLAEQLQFVEEHLIDDVKSDEKVVLGNRYSQLQQSEDEHIVLESDDKVREGFADPINSDSVLLWKRVEGDDYEDDEGSDSGSDLAESSSPDASMADIIPMLDELHPLLSGEHEAPQPTHMSHDDTDAASEHSLESSDSSSESNDDNGIDNHEDLEVGDDEEDGSKHADKQDETSPAITWTEDDQKNLMDLGTSELERNQRLENLIARRRARKAMRMQAEKNLIDLESADLPWNNIPPISTARNNPFDVSYDINIPGSAPSILVPRRNPFDLPYDSSEEKPDLVGDTFQQDFAGVQVQPKEPIFRRHESFNVGPSVFGASRHVRQETKLRPYFVPERIASDGSSFSSFQRQFSDLSDSKVSSVPDTESIGSAGELENKDHIEDDVAREAELVSEKEHEREHLELISEGEHALDAREHVSEHVSQGSESSEDDDDMESIQAVKGDDSLDEAKTSVGDVTDFPKTVEVTSSTDLMSDTVHLNMGDQEPHSSTSSMSSSYEVSEQVYDEKAGDEMLTPVPETAYYFVDRGNSIDKSNIDITNLVVAESQTLDPIYDSSPRAVRKNLSSSSLSTDLQVETSERSLSPPVSERTSSFCGTESGETVQKIETDESLKQDAAEDIRSRSITDHDLNEWELNSVISDDHLHKDESFQHNDDQLQSSSSIVVVQGDFIDSSPETRFTEDRPAIVPDNDEPLLSDDNVSSLPNMPLPETDDTLMDMEASHQVEQAQVPSPSCNAISDEVIHEEEVISQPEKLYLLDRSIDKPSAEDPEELQDHELEHDQVTLSDSEAQPPEVVHGETFEDLVPIHHQLSSEEEARSQPEKEFPLLDMFRENPSEEDPEVTQIQEPVTIDSSSSAEPDVIEVTHIETNAPENPAYLTNILPENSLENTDYFDDIKEIDKNLLEELDAVGDFGVHDLRSSLNEMKQNPHGPEPDLQTQVSGDEDKGLGSNLNEVKQNPHGSEADLQTHLSGDEDKDLGSTLNEMKQKPHGSEPDLETHFSGDEDKDLNSSLNEMKQDAYGSEHELEPDHSGGDDLGSSLNEMKEDPHASEHDLETKPYGGKGSYSADLNEREVKMDAEDVTKSQNLKESSRDTEASGRELINEASEMVVAQKNESSTPVSSSDKE